MPNPTRRAALAGLAATALVGPARAAAPRPRPAPGGPTALDPARLAAAADRARALPQLHALVIARGGEIALAEAFRGPPPDRPAPIKSVSKTIHAALVGCALDRGVLRSPRQTLAETAPALIPPGADPRVAALTLADLLSMQAGLERTSGPNYGRWVESRDWVAHALTRPFTAEPGAEMLYSTGSYHVLGAALAEAADRSLLDLARDWLGEPLGVEIPPWTRDPQGRFMGGNQMALSPLALIRFGEAHRTGGTHAGRRVLSRDWVEAAWTPRTRSPWSGDAYGWGWFLREAAGRPVAYARGYGGQFLWVAPSLGLTVAVTSDPTRPARSAGYAGALQRLLEEAILPAAEAA